MLKLAFMNASRRKKSTTLMVFITAVTIMIFVAVWNLYTITNSGIDISEERMGADILIYSEKSEGSAQDILFTGSEEMTYINEQQVLDEIPYEYVEQLTCQFYIQTLPESGCCATSESLRIVGVDLESDFLIAPWFEEEDVPTLADNEIIVGCNVKTEYGVTTTILNQSFEVKGILYATGTGLDDSIFMNIDKAREMAKKTFTPNYFDNQETDQIVSSCFVKLKDGVTASDFLAEFHPDKVEAKVAAVSEERENLRQQNQSFTRILWLFWSAIFLIAVIALFSQYYEMFRERRKEIGYLRAIGVQRRQVIFCSVVEGGVQGVAGGLAGGVLGSFLYKFILDAAAEFYAAASGNLDIVTLIEHAVCGVAFAALLSIIGAAGMTLKYVIQNSHTTLIEGDIE